MPLLHIDKVGGRSADVWASPGRGAGVKLVAVIPTYNEAGTLGALIDGLVAHCPDACELHVLVVDDASPDGTADVAAAAARRWPGRVQLLSRPAKQGLALAYVAGFARALADGADYVLQMDADGSRDPAAVPEHARRTRPGRRRDRSHARPAMGAIRATATTGGPSAASPTARSCASCRRFRRDPTSGFRLWRRDALRHRSCARCERAPTASRSKWRFSPRAPAVGLPRCRSISAIAAPAVRK